MVESFLFVPHVFPGVAAMHGKRPVDASPFHGTRNAAFRLARLMSLLILMAHAGVLWAQAQQGDAARPDMAISGASDVREGNGYFFRDSDRFDGYGGYKGLQGRKTGWFHLEEIQGLWWFVTPDGNVFYSNGLNTIRPDWEAQAAFQSQYGGRLKDWARETVRFLHEHNFNTLGSDHFDPKRKYIRPLSRQTPRMVYTEIIMALKPGYEHPARQKGALWDDVFSDEARNKVHEKVKALAQERKNDPYLLGYYTNNEVCWGVFGPKSGWLQSYMKLPASAPGKQAFVNHIRQRYGGSLQKFNREVYHPDLYRGKHRIMAAKYGRDDYIWEPLQEKDERFLSNLVQTLHPLSSWSDLAGMRQPGKWTFMARMNRQWTADLESFMGLVAQRYAELHVDAVQKYDGHHLVLGPRIAMGMPPVYPWPVAIAITRGFGIWCENFYWDSNDPNDERGQQFIRFVNGIHARTGVPVLFSEFGGYMDETLTKFPKPTMYVPVKGQRERARRFLVYRNQIYRFPFVVGAHFYSYIDHARSNWGIVDDQFRPYAPLVAAMKAEHPLVYEKRLHRED